MDSKNYRTMRILQKYKLIAKGNKAINIGVGLGDSEFHNQKILTASLRFVKEFNSTVFLFGKTDDLRKILDEKINSQVGVVECNLPEKSIIEFLMKDTIQAIVRGSLSSNNFLTYLKIDLNVRDFNRLAVMETFEKHQFFYGPVGIDECANLEKKILFLESSLKELQKIEIEPIISILSGGRSGDIGRDIKVDQSIQEADKIIKIMKEKYPNIQISHDEILIEKAIENKSNLIMAPDGISGNLIYRTLVHLGGGKAYGAIYMGVPKTIIDTSRVGSQSEIYGALVLALALSK